MFTKVKPAFLALALLAFAGPAQASLDSIAAEASIGQPAVIRYDGGGSLLYYFQSARVIREAGVPVKIAGLCASACTMILMVPKQRICVTKTAELWFHQASRFGQRHEVGTQMMLATYPAAVKDWIRARGGLSEEFKVMKGADLAVRFRICPDA